ncbi:MAG TPA: ABC transporter permease [Gemmatimonadaceae bacterium]|nr:ABC transporter permease [Gemmatimonadaceae bacterium]
MGRIARFLRLPRSAARIRIDIDDEIAFDIDMRARDLVRQGMDSREAQARAAREFGDLDATRRYCEDLDMQIEADARRVSFLEDVHADLRVALRGMRRGPLFAAVVLLTLALGIGANTAVFSVVRRVLITPLPFRAPEQLYRLYTTPSATDGDNDKLSLVELTELATQSRSLAGLTLFGSYQGVTYSDDHTADSWQSVSVAPNFFDILGVRPVLGRAFRTEDFVQGAPSVLIVTYQVWQRVFGGDRGLVGRVVQLNAKPFTVVGVLPEYFVGPTFNADMLLPFNVDAAMRSPRFARSRAWRSVARLRPGVSLEQWRVELTVLRQRIQGAHPDIKNAGVVLPTPLHEAIVGRAGPVLWLVMGGAIIVLLATCVNIAGLFLSRAAARRRELGIRTALGAGRGRLVRQVLAETLLYGVVGGAIGIILGAALKAALLRIAGPMLPKLGDVRIDAGVLLFAVAASVASGIIFGVMPAAATTRVDVRDALGDSGARGASRGAATARASRLLVSAQVAFALVLVVGASLFVRTFKTLLDTDLGYETTSHQATFFLNFGAGRRSPDSQQAFVALFMQRLHALPGVAAVGYTVTNPWNGSWISPHFQIEGRLLANDRPSAVLSTASAEYFKAMGMPVRMGRGFDASDGPGGAPVAVISESMAQRFWPNSSPIGARIRLTDFYAQGPSDTLLAREVVGVVSDVKEDAMSNVSPTIYLPAEQAPVGGGSFVVRTTGEAATLLPLIKDAAHSLDAKIPMVSPRTLRDVLSNIVRRQNVAMTLTGLFALLALVLAGLGVYGIMSYNVLARTREFGIRSALGASRGAVLGLVLRDGLATTLLGLGAGLLLAAGLSRFAASLLVGVTAHDPLSYVVGLVILGLVSLIACAVPARVATQVEPVEALRLE